MTAAYLDTSAAVRLVVTEPETSALRRWLRSTDLAIVASDLVRTELLRVTRKAAPTEMHRARAVLEALTLLALTPEICERAALLQPPTLRTLDALHLAAALELGDDLTGVITYDDRLAEPVAALGHRVIAPR